MIHVKVAYDAYNQQFRLIDSTMSRLLEDGEVYLLVVDFFPTGLSDDELTGFTAAEIGHA